MCSQSVFFMNWTVSLLNNASFVYDRNRETSVQSSYFVATFLVSRGTTNMVPSTEPSTADGVQWDVMGKGSGKRAPDDKHVVNRARTARRYALGGRQACAGASGTSRDGRELLASGCTYSRVAWRHP